MASAPEPNYLEDHQIYAVGIYLERHGQVLPRKLAPNLLINRPTAPIPQIRNGLAFTSAANTRPLRKKPS